MERQFAGVNYAVWRHCLISGEHPSDVDMGVAAQEAKLAEFLRFRRHKMDGNARRRADAVKGRCGNALRAYIVLHDELFRTNDPSNSRRLVASRGTSGTHAGRLSSDARG